MELSHRTKNAFKNVNSRRIKIVKKTLLSGSGPIVFPFQKEFVILLILVLSKKSLPKNERLQRFKNESMNHEIDFNNTISSAFHAEELYDELKVKCHPDRFPMNPEKSRTAEMFFQEITKNKHNMKRLLELKEQAKHELNINF